MFTRGSDETSAPAQTELAPIPLLDDGTLEQPLDGTLQPSSREFGPEVPMRPPPRSWVPVLVLFVTTTLALGMFRQTPETPVASVEQAREAFRWALATDLPERDALVLRMSYAELLEHAGDPAARAQYARIAVDGEGTWLGKQARRRLE